jgi:uncharacterized protein (TIGR03086 family)
VNPVQAPRLGARPELAGFLPPMISGPIDRLYLYEVAADHRRTTVIDVKPAGDRMIEVLGGVTDDQLAGTSPCAEYTVGDLVDHVDHFSRLFAAFARHDSAELQRVGPAPTPVHLDPDWHQAVPAHVRLLVEAWEDPAAWQGANNMPGSDLSNETWGKITLTELVVHGWDIATATGRPFRLPEVTLRACFDHVVAFLPHAPVPAMWGPPVEVGSSATLVDQIVAVTGRTP